MSKHNKANKDAYVQGGRLTPDDMARERIKQAQVSGRAKSKENVIGKMPSRPGEQGSTRHRNEREE
jgi:hypothetical protein